MKITPFILGMVLSAQAFAQVNVVAAGPNVITAPVAVAAATNLTTEVLKLRSAGQLNDHKVLNLLNSLLINAEAHGMQRDWFVDDQIAYTLNSYANSNNLEALRKSAYTIGVKILVTLNRGYVQPEKLGEKTLISITKFKGPLKTVQASIMKELYNYESGKLSAEQLFEMYRPKNPSYVRLLAMYQKISTMYKNGEIKDSDAPANRLMVGPKGPYAKDKARYAGSPDANARMAVDYKASIAFARKRLELFGYKTEVQDFEAQYTTYTQDLNLAIQDLQENNLLVKDGVLGDNTFGIIGMPIEQVITRLKINLDRSRWLPDETKSEYVHVNLAAQRLFYYKDNAIALSFRTINGAKDRPTPILSSNITSFILNPTWTVAPTSYFKDKTKMFGSSAGLNDVLEKRYSFKLNSSKVLADYDAAYRAQTGQEYPFITMMRTNTNPDGTITADATTWPAFMQLFRDEEKRFLSVPGAKTDSFARALTIVQRPGGDQNALGWIKFPLNGTNSIYMHDTNQRELFAETDRLKSSGCVRMEKPWDLAIMLLGATKDATTGEYVNATTIDTLTGLPFTIDSLHARTINRMPLADRPDADLKLGRSVPVYMLYDTAQINDHGQMTLVKDHYGIDIDMYNIMMGISTITVPGTPLAGQQ